MPKHMSISTMYKMKQRKWAHTVTFLSMQKTILCVRKSVHTNIKFIYHCLYAKMLS